jgi:CubicO group peptidase (beta-lactamase class C family)
MADRSVSAFEARRARGRAVLRRSLGIALALAALSSLAQAQTSVDLAALDAYFSQAGEAWQVPGFAIAIVKDDELVFAKGYGVRELRKSARVDEHTLFAIASNSKAFTAAALAKLVAEGQIGWDDRVIDHLPYFQLYSPYVTQEMRIRDLLCHRSGLGTYSGDLLWYGTSYSPAEVVRRARHLEPAGPFRAHYGYSNLMFIAAGEIIPAVTGRSWNEYVEAEYFGPLGMASTVTSVTDLEGKTNVATPHAEKEGDVVPLEWYNWDAMAAAGGIISSVSDMAGWLRLQLNRGTLDGVTYFSEEASRTMWTPHNNMTVTKQSEELYPSTHFRGYGLGWGLSDYLGRKIMSHGGGYDGMFSRVVLVPEEKLGIVVLTNSMTSLPTALAYRTLDAYMGGEPKDWNAALLEQSRRSKESKRRYWEKFEEERVADTRPSKPLQGYTGTYGGAMYGDATVVVEDDGLVVSLQPNPDLVGDLSHWHYDTYVVEWRKQFAWFGKGTVQFVMDARGEVVEMKIDVPNDDLWFTELEFKKKE